MVKIAGQPKKWEKVTIRHSAEIAALHQKAHVPVSEIVEMYPQYSRRSIYRHASKPFNEEHHDRRKYNKGRPGKLNLRHKRIILRMIPKLRREDASFTLKKLAIASGVEDKVNIRTLSRFLNKNGYRYRRALKKGVLHLGDLIKRKAFCRRVKRLKLGGRFWTHGVSMYIDGKGMIYFQYTYLCVCKFQLEQSD